LAPADLRRSALALTLLTLATMVALRLLDAPLRTDAAPLGIVSFELAGGRAEAAAIIASWGTEGRVYAGLSLGLDYLFLFAYAGAIALGCVWVARRLAQGSRAWLRLGLTLAWALPLAAALDALENLALIRVLLGGTGDLWPRVALLCALPKFAIVLAGLVYLLVGGIRARGAR